MDSATLSRLLGRTVGFGLVVAVSAATAQADATDRLPRAGEVGIGVDADAESEAHRLVPETGSEDQLAGILTLRRLDFGLLAAGVASRRSPGAFGQSAFGEHAARELSLTSWMNLVGRARRG